MDQRVDPEVAYVLFVYDNLRIIDNNGLAVYMPPATDMWSALPESFHMKPTQKPPQKCENDSVLNDKLLDAVYGFVPACVIGIAAFICKTRLGICVKRIIAYFCCGRIDEREDEEQHEISQGSSIERRGFSDDAFSISSKRTSLGSPQASVDDSLQSLVVKIPLDRLEATDEVKKKKTIFDRPRQPNPRNIFDINEKTPLV